MFAFEWAGVVPDILALSKTLGGGFPLAAVIMSDTIAAVAERNGMTYLTSHMNEPAMAMIGLAMVGLAEEHVARLGPGSEIWDVVEQPADLRS